MPAVLATEQLTLVAAITDFNAIAGLYDKYAVSGKESLHLVSLYDERVRHDWAKRCSEGEQVDIEHESKEVNKEIWELCKQQLDAILKNANLSPSKGI